MLLRLTGALICLLTIAISASAAPITIRINPLAEASSPKAMVTEYLKKLLEERSHGRIQAEIDDTTALKAEEVLSELDQRNIQMVIPEISLLQKQVPQLRMYELPFLYRDRQHLYQFIDDESTQQTFPDLSQIDLKILGIWGSGTKQLIADRKLSSPEIAASMAFVGLEEQVPTFFFKRFSACASAPALEKQKGTWKEALLPDLVDKSQQSMFANLTLTNHSFSGCALLMQRNFWHHLPDDLKVIVADAVNDATVYARELSEQSDQQALDEISASGLMKIHRLSQVQWNHWQEKMLLFYSETCSKVELSFIKRVTENKSR